jgi:DNA-binding transcriptional regulator YiaG
MGDTESRWLSAAEFAAVLQVSEEDVRGWIAEGRLPSELEPLALIDVLSRSEAS